MVHPVPVIKRPPRGDGGVSSMSTGDPFVFDLQLPRSRLGAYNTGDSSVPPLATFTGLRIVEFLVLPFGGCCVPAK